MHYSGIFIAVFLACALFVSAAQAEEPVPYTDTATFNEKVLGAPVPVLLQFDAKWCPYCRKMQPVIANFAGEAAGNPLVMKIDVDRDAAITDRYGIRTLPTLILFSQGNEIARHEGAMDAEKLKKWMAAVLPE